MNKARSLAFVIAIGCFFAGVYLANYYHSSPAVADTEASLTPPSVNSTDVLDQLAPDFQLLDVAGRLRESVEWQEMVVVINFWATWCAPCLHEIPEFVALQAKYADQGVQFVGITLDSAQEVAAFSAKLGINYPLLVGSVKVIKLAEQFGNSFGYLPYTVIIDRTGMIRFIKQGRLPLAEAEEEIIRWL